MFCRQNWQFSQNILSLNGELKFCWSKRHIKFIKFNEFSDQIQYGKPWLYDWNGDIEIVLLWKLSLKHHTCLFTKMNTIRLQRIEPFCPPRAITMWNKVYLSSYSLLLVHTHAESCLIKCPEGYCGDKVTLQALLLYYWSHWWSVMGFWDNENGGLIFTRNAHTQLMWPPKKQLNFLYPLFTTIHDCMDWIAESQK